MSKFFGNTNVSLLGGHSLKPVESTAAALEGKKYTLVYFSAHWCPPCRAFTPQLRRFYEDHKDQHNFEVLFVSLDNSAEAMAAYMESAHGDWLAMRYDSATTVGKQWAKTYGITTIPALLVFENNGNSSSGEVNKEGSGDGGTRRLITSVGKDMVVHDEAAERFPWADGEREMRSYNRGLLRNLLICVVIALVLGYFLATMKV